VDKEKAGSPCGFPYQTISVDFQTTFVFWVLESFHELLLSAKDYKKLIEIKTILEKHGDQLW